MKFGFDSERAREFPSIVQLTITNVCDMSCYHCPHSDYANEPEFKPRFMDLELFRKIADEMGNQEDSYLRIFGWGEPLLHRKLPEMINYAKKAGVGLTSLITNGLKLNREKSIKLIESGLDVLEVSLDAFSEATYEKIRGKKENFRQVVDNIKDYITLRDEYDGHTYVTVSIINQPKASREVEDFVDYWSGYADDVVIRTFHDFMGTADDQEKIVLPERHPCRCLWSRFNINTEGLVSVCFNDWYNESIIGEIKSEDSTIKKIWGSRLYEEYRQSHLIGSPMGVCSNCNDWIGASWEFPYEVLMKKAKDKIDERKKS